MKVENRIVEVSQNGKKWLKRVFLFKKGDGRIVHYVTGRK